MRETRLALRDLRDLLSQCGFSLHPNAAHESFDLPKTTCEPDRYLTVAIEIDPTLKDEYFLNYFVCTSEPFFELIARRDADAEDAWAESIIDCEPWDLYCLLAGPGSWLLSRLVQHQTAIVWADRPLRGTPRQWDSEASDALAESNVLRIEGLDSKAAIGLCAGMIRTVFETGVDQYLFFPESSELYTVHHHDKVILEVPDGSEPVMQAVIDELNGCSAMRRVDPQTLEDSPFGDAT